MRICQTQRIQVIALVYFKSSVIGTKGSTMTERIEPRKTVALAVLDLPK